MGVERGELNPVPGFIARRALGQRWLLPGVWCSPAGGLCWRIDPRGCSFGVLWAGEGKVTAERQRSVSMGLQGLWAGMGLVLVVLFG